MVYGQGSKTWKIVPFSVSSPPLPSPSAPARLARRWATSTATDKADLVVVNQGSNTISVLLGNGNGTFQPRTDYATGTGPAGVAVGDFNGDGKLDIAVANKGANSVSILLGNGDGTFQPKTDIALPLTPVALTVGDFNGDGKADLAVATYNATQDAVTMLLGNGNGTFQLPVTTVTDTIPFVGGNDLGLAGTGRVVDPER